VPTAALQKGLRTGNSPCAYGVLAAYDATCRPDGCVDDIVDSGQALLLPSEAAAEVRGLFSRMVTHVQRFLEDGTALPQLSPLPPQQQQQQQQQQQEQQQQPRRRLWRPWQADQLRARLARGFADLVHRSSTQHAAPFTYTGQAAAATEQDAPVLPAQHAVHLSQGAPSAAALYAYEHLLLPFLRHWATLLLQRSAPPPDSGTLAVRLLRYLLDNELWACAVLLLEVFPDISAHALAAGLQLPTDLNDLLMLQRLRASLPATLLPREPSWHGDSHVGAGGSSCERCSAGALQALRAHAAAYGIVSRAELAAEHGAAPGSSSEGGSSPDASYESGSELLLQLAELEQCRAAISAADDIVDCNHMMLPSASAQLLVQHGATASNSDALPVNSECCRSGCVSGMEWTAPGQEQPGIWPWQLSSPAEEACLPPQQQQHQQQHGYYHHHNQQEQQQQQPPPPQSPPHPPEEHTKLLAEPTASREAEQLQTAKASCWEDEWDHSAAPYPPAAAAAAAAAGCSAAQWQPAQQRSQPPVLPLPPLPPAARPAALLRSAVVGFSHPAAEAAYCVFRSHTSSSLDSLAAVICAAMLAASTSRSVSTADPEAAAKLGVLLLYGAFFFAPYAVMYAAQTSYLRFREVLLVGARVSSAVILCVVAVGLLAQPDAWVTAVSRTASMHLTNGLILPCCQQMRLPAAVLVAAAQLPSDTLMLAMGNRSLAQAALHGVAIQATALVVVLLQDVWCRHRFLQQQNRGVPQGWVGTPMYSSSSSSK
jgi:hypothetical protein